MSYQQGDEIHIDEDEASAGAKTGVMRWVLGISLFAAIALLSAIWMFGASTQDDSEDESSLSAKIAESEEDKGTDSIVADDFDTAEGADLDTVTGSAQPAGMADGAAEDEAAQ